jgi:hypothetical protein
MRMGLTPTYDEYGMPMMDPHGRQPMQIVPVTNREWAYLAAGAVLGLVLVRR